MSAFATGVMLGAPEVVTAGRTKIVIRHTHGNENYEWHGRCQACLARGRRIIFFAHTQSKTFELARRHAFTGHGVTL